MKAVITVIGKDSIGIISLVSGKCSEYGVNILDITQSVMQDYFAMIMLVDTSAANVDFATLSSELAETGKERGLEIRVMHEDIFKSMHHI